MDAPELEQDIQLERSAPNLLADLGRSLPLFLRRNKRIRRNVRSKDMDRLVNLLEPFQELPQLLDPHLNVFVPTLANALLDYLRAPPSKKPHTHLLIPSSKAICKLLYTFCKIRGEKVIVQFFGTETRDLELLLGAIEKGTTWDWEERYIALLWLSQLLLAPFDLASISSRGNDVKLDISGFTCPPNVPTVTLRVISLAVRYLSSSGKERDAAKVLLVRVAMRPDMQQLGVLRALVGWTISRLSGVENSPYVSIGILSFLAGLLVSSAGTPDVVEYLPGIFDVTRSDTLRAITKSAVSRKILIKIFRAIALLDLANSQLDRVQTIIGDLLDFLEDGSTPVRLAASKALSIITLKLDPEMASQVVEAVLDTFGSTYRIVKGKVDLSDVKAFQWHGLILTFSHLLYRRSIPPESLPPVLNALRLGLSFEKRSTSSSISTGTNVRDAANFGIWALARRYTTREIGPVLQSLANDLVVAASLDSAGNVRRGSSAALQELIGRNSDTIVEGIQVVQVVDYHAIALRSRGVDVGIGAAGLADEYHHAVLEGLLGWRGIKDTNAGVRRTAALAVGKLVWEKGLVSEILERLVGRMQELAIRDGDERHGLLLCIAAVIQPFTGATESPSSISRTPVRSAESVVNAPLSELVVMLAHNSLIPRTMSIHSESEVTQSLAATTDEQPSLPSAPAYTLSETASSQAVSETVPIHTPQAPPSIAQKPLSEISASVYNTQPDTITSASALPDNVTSIVIDILKYVDSKWTSFRNQSLIAEAACKIIIASRTPWMQLQEKFRDVDDPLYFDVISDAAALGPIDFGAHLYTLAKVFNGQQEILDAIENAWHTGDRAMILRGLGPMRETELVRRLVWEGLDDFTITAQGDVGSKVRIEAAKLSKIDERLMKVAGGKMDRVRSAAFKGDTTSEGYFLAILKIQRMLGIEGGLGAMEGASDVGRASRWAWERWVEED